MLTYGEMKILGAPELFAQVSHYSFTIKKDGKEYTGTKITTYLEATDTEDSKIQRIDEVPDLTDSEMETLINL